MSCAPYISPEASPAEIRIRTVYYKEGEAIPSGATSKAFLRGESMTESVQATFPKGPTRLVFTGLRSINIGDDEEVELIDGFSLLRPNDFLLSARDHYGMNQRQYDEAPRASRYLVHRRVTSILEPEAPYDTETIQNGLVAFQIIKPVQTLGFTFHGRDRGGPTFHPELSEERPPVVTGQWARMRQFDQQLLDQVPSMIKRVVSVMQGASVEKKNAVTFLQLGLETNRYHQLIAGLLWVTGMEAIFDSGNRNDFKQKLCDCLGPSTLVFPDWNHPTSPPAHTVEELAIPVYMLRNKLAHGADLRTAAFDKSTPVDLTKQVKLVDFLEPRPNAYLLSEAACYLLCQVLQKTI
jgi:hypothetical protein